MSNNEQVKPECRGCRAKIAGEYVKCKTCDQVYHQRCADRTNILEDGGYLKCCGKSRSNSESSQSSQHAQSAGKHQTEQENTDDEIDDSENDTARINITKDIGKLEARLNKKLNDDLIDMNKSLFDMSQNLQQIFTKRIKSINEELNTLTTQVEGKIKKIG